MKSLEAVQRIYKIFGILVKIVFVFGIIGSIGSLIGGFVMLTVPILGEDLVNLIVSAAEVDNITQLAMGLIAVAVFVAGQTAVTWFISKYFKNEQTDGTPFTKRGADELMRVGIINLAVTFGAYFAASLIASFAGANEFLSGSASAIGGISMILISFIFRYGAELEDAVKEKQ